MFTTASVIGNHLKTIVPLVVMNAIVFKQQIIVLTPQVKALMELKYIIQNPASYISLY